LKLSEIKALLPLLIPSWRFFDLPGERYIFSFRSAPEGEWKAAIAEPQRRWWNLFYNPQGNLALAFHSIVERVVIEVGDAVNIEAFEASLSYKQLLCVVKTAAFGDNTSNVQFRIRANDTLIMQSKWHAL
jgi:hypothetical protein